MRRSRSQKDFREEIASHLQLEIDRLIAEGMPPQEADAQARRHFGNVTTAEERFYERGRFLWLDNLWRDFAYAARGFLRQPLLVLSACVSLALGTGVNAAFVAMIHSLVLLPVTTAVPEQLVTLWVGFGNRVSHANFRSFVDAGIPLAGYRMHDLRMETKGEPVRINGQEVSANYFELLGISTALGTPFTTQRVKQDANVMVVSHGFWRDVLESDPNVVGRRIRVSGKAYIVSGVLPAGFRSIWGIGISPAVYFPTGSELAPTLIGRGENRYELIGRLSQDESAAQFRDRALGVARSLAEAFPDENRDLGQVRIWAFPKLGKLAGQEGAFIPPVMLFATVLFVLVGIVVVIACANVASMLLARGANRQREIGVRLAIGCGRGRLIQFLFAESFLLGVLGVALGALFGIWLAQAISRYPLPIPVPVDFTISIDWRFMAYIAGLVLFVTLLAGMAPVWQLRRVSPIRGVHGDRMTGGRGGRFSLRGFLVGAQVAMATLLLVGSCLFVRSLWRSLQVSPGFDLEHVAMADLDLQSAGLSNPNAGAFEERVIQRFLEIPGVESASAVALVPLTMNTRVTGLQIDGGNELRKITIMNNTIRPDYFRTMQIRLLQGRDFTAGDLKESGRVAIVNQTFAQRVFGSEAAVGRKIRRPTEKADEPWTEIIGVVADNRHMTLGESPQPAVFWLTKRLETLTVVARVTGSPDAMLPALRSAIRDVDPRVGATVRPLRSVLTLALFPARAAAVLLGALGLLALVLTMTGLYGLIAYSVSRRTSEIGVRMALGATQAAVLRLVLRDGLRVSGSGLVIGVLLALAGGRVVQSLLVGVSGSDPVSFGAVVLVLLATGMLASYLPAWRATRIDPMKSLRQE